MRLTIPNQLTLLRFLLTFVFLYYFLPAEPVSQLIASVIFVMATLTDWYDGWYARKFGVITRWGQFMDPLADKFLVSTALIIFAVMDYVKWWMVWIIVGRDVLVTIIRVYAINKGTAIVTSLLAKWKTFGQMAMILAILAYVNWLNFYGNSGMTYHAQYFDTLGLGMLSITLLTIISAILYCYENWRLIWRMLKEIFVRTSG
jgi:CDP-diacylglycerol---glycerol-3-phosphate 3-phosphatidyltransferase